MTAETVTEDIGVVEYRREPRGRIVAIVTLVARRDVIRRLTRRLHTVMACPATAGDCGVIHVCNRAPCRCCVAISTYLC